MAPLLIPQSVIGSSGKIKENWISSFSGGRYNSKIRIDSSGNQYVLLSTQIVKYALDGSILWQIDVGNIKDFDLFPNGDLAIAGARYIDGNTSNPVVARVSGSTQQVMWQYEYTASSIGTDLVEYEWINISVDKSGNDFIYISADCALPYSSTYYYTGWFLSLTGTGTVKWGKKINTPYTGTGPTGNKFSTHMVNIYADNSGVVVGGRYDPSTYYGWDSQVALFDLNGNQQWARRLYPTVSQKTVRVDDIARNGASYSLMCSVDPGGYTYMTILPALVELGGNGTLNRKSEVYQTDSSVDGGNYMYPSGIAIDSATNEVYILSWGTESSPDPDGYETYVFKWPAGGTSLSYAREIDPAGTVGIVNYGIGLYGNNFYTAGYNFNSQQIYFNLPKDGSKTKSYTFNGLEYDYRPSANMDAHDGTHINYSTSAELTYSAVTFSRSSVSHITTSTTSDSVLIKRI